MTKNKLKLWALFGEVMLIKKMKHIYFSLLILFIFFINNSFGQSVWTNYNIPVQSFTIDSKDTIWIGNKNGLSKFKDNSILSTVPTSGFTYLVPDKNIFSIATTRYGVKLIGTRGLLEMRGNQGFIANSSDRTANADYIYQVEMDKVSSNVDYFGWLLCGDGNKVKKATFSNGHYVYGMGNPVDIGASINYIKLVKRVGWNDSQITLLCATNGKGVYSESTNSYLNTSNSKIASNIVMSIAVDSKGHRWFATSLGLCKFDEVNNIWNTYINPYTDGKDMGQIVVDSYDNIWVCSLYGLSKFDGVNWVNYNTKNSEIPSDDVRSIIIDSKNNKWLNVNGLLVKFSSNGKSKICNLTNIINKKEYVKCHGSSKVTLTSKIKDVSNNYSWFDGDNKKLNVNNIDSIVVSKIGLYKLKVADSECHISDSIELYEIRDTIPLIPAPLDLKVDKHVLCENSYVVLHSNYSKSNVIQWLNQSGDTIISNNQDSLVFPLSKCTKLGDKFLYYVQLKVSDSMCYSQYVNYQYVGDIYDSIPNKPLFMDMKIDRYALCSNSYSILHSPYDKSNKIQWLDYENNIISNNQDTLKTSIAYIKIKVADNVCGNQYSIFDYSLNINDTFPGLKEICMVTNQAGHNLIIWDNTDNKLVTKYNIYKQNHITSNYDLVHEQSKTILSQWLDTLSSNQIERYRLTVVDSCGHESQQSNIHTTILLSSNLGYNGKVNLNWNAYEGFYYQNFEIWRSTNGINFNLLSTVANNTYSYIDNNPPSKGFYQIRISKSSSCTPTLKSYNSICSNIVNKKGEVLDIKNVEINKINIYPNPTNNSININNLKQGSLITILDINGRVIYTNSITSESLLIPLYEVASKGIYFLNVLENEKVLETLKVILE
jgi:hypothetical protein